MTSTAAKETTSAPEKQEEVTENLRAKVFSKSSPAPPSSEMPAASLYTAATNGDNDSIASTSTVNGDAGKFIDTPKDTIAVVKALDTPSKEELTKVTDKATKKEQPIFNDTIAVAAPKSLSTATTGDSAVKPSSLPQTVTKPTNGTVTKPAVSAKASTKKDPQVIIPSTKKPPLTPTPTTNGTLLTHKKPTAQEPITAPSKRSIAPPSTATPPTPSARRSHSAL